MRIYMALFKCLQVDATDLSGLLDFTDDLFSEFIKVLASKHHLLQVDHRCEVSNYEKLLSFTASAA